MLNLILVLNLYLIIQCHLLVIKGHFSLILYHEQIAVTNTFNGKQKHATHVFIYYLNILSLCVPWEGLQLTCTAVPSNKSNTLKMDSIETHNTNATKHSFILPL